MTTPQQPSPDRTALTSVRRREIQEILRAESSVTVAEIQARFDVSAMTARRDLAELERRGHARRTHGGAVLPAITSHEDSFQSRLERAAEGKNELALAAAALVSPGESVFLDSSSTAYHAARALLDRGIHLTLITNSQPIMDLVASHHSTDVDLIGIGGQMRRLTRSFVGPLATAAVAAHYADRLFFSVKGLSTAGAMTDADPLEAEVKRSMIEHAQTSTLLVDHTKIGVRGLAVIDQLSAVDSVLAAGLEEDALDRIGRDAVELQVVPDAGEEAA